MGLIRMGTVGLVLAVAPAAEAAAATVSYKPPKCFERGCAPSEVTFQAAAGEVNRLTVTAVGDELEFRDGAAVVGAGRGCRAIDGHAARCPVGDVVMARLGDRDDEAASAGPTRSVTVYGDDGDDLIRGPCAGHGGPGNDRIDQCTIGWGDDGDDVLIAPRTGELFPVEGSLLTGGPGADHLQGGDGDDVLHDASLETNRFDGGGGADTVSFVGRTAPVVVDLAAQLSTTGVLMTSIEAIEGGEAADVLLGSDGADLVEGGAGEDVIGGRAGNDRIAGGPGFDHLDGGAGDDLIDADAGDFGGSPTYYLGIVAEHPYWDAEPEPVACGPGRDRVRGLGGDLVGLDCERLLKAGFVPAPRRVRGGWRWSIPCTKQFRFYGRCRGTVTLDGGTYGDGRQIEPLQRRRFDIRGRRGRVVFSWLPLDVFEIRVHVSINRGRGEPVIVRWRLDRDLLRRRAASAFFTG